MAIKINQDKLEEMAVIAIANSLKRKVGQIPHQTPRGGLGDYGWWTDALDPDPNNRWHIRHFLEPSYANV